MPLDRLLRPGAIAVIGGGRWCEQVITGCRRFGFGGDLHAVHPGRAEVAGCPAVPRVSDLPRPPDAAFVGVNRERTVEVVRDLAGIGAGGAVCFASGYAEAAGELPDGPDLQAALVSAAGEMPILGPNCYGFLNALDGAALWPDQHGLVQVDRGVAIIAQSSNIALNLTMQARGLPMAYVVTVGNQAQTGLAAVGEALLDDDRVTAIGLYVEGIGDLAAFQRFARRARDLGRPVAALKVGLSDRARAATVSHTAAIAGSTGGASALFDRLGIARVDSLPVLLETLKLLHVTGGIASADLALMSCSGGEASLMADAAEGVAVRFPDLTPAQRETLRAILGPRVALANPLDYHTYIWGDVEATRRTLLTILDGPAHLGLVVLDLPRADRCTPEAWLPVIDAARAAAARTSKRVAILSTLPECMPEPLARDLIGDGIVPFCGTTEALAAIAAAARATALVRAEPVCQSFAPARPRALTEADAKARLAAHGLPVPRGATARGAAEAEAVAARIGYPVVLTLMGVPHKTEAGALALSLADAAAVRRAARDLPGEDFLVEEMVGGVLAELLVGILRDPAHGLVLTLAPGGTLAELMDDRAFLSVPASRPDVDAALASLRCDALLRGHRGAPACDRGAIVDAVMALQACARAAPVTEIEVNPLLCGRDFAVAADALMICGETDDA